MIPNDYFQLKKELLGCYHNHHNQIICCPECGCNLEDKSTINTEFWKCSNCKWEDTWEKTLTYEEWVNKNRFEKLENILKNNKYQYG
jgi:DNA-directed RNA polymerase subunit M/transcription elongation factor TFIIS